MLASLMPLKKMLKDEKKPPKPLVSGKKENMVNLLGHLMNLAEHLPQNTKKEFLSSQIKGRMTMLIQKLSAGDKT